MTKYSVKWLSIHNTYHFICCISNPFNHTRYYIDNETKSGFGIVYLKIKDVYKEKDIDKIKQFYYSRNYELYHEELNKINESDENNESKFSQLYNDFGKIGAFISPHIVNGFDEINTETNTNTTKQITETHCTVKNNIQLGSELIDSHNFSIDPTFSYDKLHLKHFSLSPSYKNVFNQFASFMKNEYDDLKDEKITDLLKLCLDIPQFNLYTYTNS